MLIHHSAEDYGSAAKRAADWASKRLEELIAAGKQKAIDTINQVRTMQPKDFVIPSTELFFKVAETSRTIEAWFGTSEGRGGHGHRGRSFGIHPHALEQIGERCDMPNPKRVMSWMMEGPDGPGDLVQTLNHKYSRQTDKRYLVRVVNDSEIRGVLSDRFRRLDSAPIVEAFIDRILALGAVPLEGRALDTKFYLKVVLPHILEPLPGEVMLWGAQLKNSDFGDGKLEITGFVHRLRCTNLAMTEDGFAKIHLGGRLDDNIEFSQKTYELDTQTTASAVKDVVNNIFEPEHVKTKMEVIRHLAKENTDTDAVLKALRSKSKMTKAEADEVAKLFSSTEIELLPPGQNLWRLSNAISLLSQSAEPNRQLELEELAGEVAGLRKTPTNKDSN